MDLAKRRLRIGAGLEMVMKPLGTHKAKTQPKRTPMAIAIPTRDWTFFLRLPPIISTTSSLSAILGQSGEKIEEGESSGDRAEETGAGGGLASGDRAEGSGAWESLGNGPTRGERKKTEKENRRERQREKENRRERQREKERGTRAEEQQHIFILNDVVLLFDC
ncbi:hypothetical protein ACLB2K_064976 [Fragaria x ananassa]